MLPIQSPQYSNSSKVDLFCKQRSPSLRSKRIPSMQECLSSQHLKLSKSDSPSEIRRRKSQHDSHNLNNSNGKKKSKIITNNNCTQDLIASIQDLKEEYKVLREAYKQLIQEKLKNAEELNLTKMDNAKLRSALQQAKKNEVALKNQLTQKESQLQAQRKIREQLQTDIYFLRERADLGESETMKQPPEIAKFTGSDQIDQICCRSFSSESNILSFSLTSALEDSLQEKTNRKREHVKVVSNLQQFHGEFENVELKPKKESISSANFKKNKKQSLKIDLAEQKEVKQFKPLAALHPLNQLLSLKSPLSAAEKKGFKGTQNNQNSSNSKRRKEDKENLQPKAKKKSKKLLLQTPPE